MVANLFIENICLRHGAPELLITDRGMVCTADLTQATLGYIHTSHRRATGYYQQTNRLTERLHKTIADMLVMCLYVEHKTCDSILPNPTFAYNTAVQETTRMTPYQLVYGRKLGTTLDAMLPNVTKEENFDVTVYLHRAEEARQHARLRIKNQQTTDSRRYNLARSFRNTSPATVFAS